MGDVDELVLEVEEGGDVGVVVEGLGVLGLGVNHWKK